MARCLEEDGGAERTRAAAAAASELCAAAAEAVETSQRARRPSTLSLVYLSTAQGSRKQPLCLFSLSLSRLLPAVPVCLLLPCHFSVPYSVSLSDSLILSDAASLCLILSLCLCWHPAVSVAGVSPASARRRARGFVILDKKRIKMNVRCKRHTTSHVCMYTPSLDEAQQQQQQAHCPAAAAAAAACPNAAC